MKSMVMQIEKIDNTQSGISTDAHASIDNTQSIQTKKPKNGKRIFVIIGILLILIGVITGGVFFTWSKGQLRPVDNSKDNIEFEVKSGTDAVTISNNLESKGLIRNSQIFRLYLKDKQLLDKLQAGYYLLSPSMTSEEIAEVIVSGKVATRTIRIPPGLTLLKIKKYLVKSGFSSKEVDSALKAQYRGEIFASKPELASLEGLIFPDTYNIPLKSGPEELIQLSLDNFESKISDEMKTGIKENNLTLYEAITLSSIVQKEISNPKDQKQVAQVFLKRLEISMNLGSDVTFLYVAEQTGKKPNINVDSPYNTRRYPGLPPGPISNFNISALEAVSFPSDGDYLYFVAGDNGKTYFSKTLQEHEDYASKYCIELCKL